MKYITLEEILRLHFKVVEDYGGLHGVRDESRLKSFIEAPKQSAFGEEQYKTIFEKAAVYMRNIIADHPFYDGNKRSGVAVAAIFIMRNGYELTATPKELEDFAVEVAVKKLSVEEIAQWLQDNSSKK